MEQNYCAHPLHSRPATAEEAVQDQAKRWAAIEEVEHYHEHSARQIEEARRTMETFFGYRRCTKEKSPNVSAIMRGKVLIQLGDSEPIEVGTIKLPLNPIQITVNNYDDRDPRQVAKDIAAQLCPK